MASKKLGGRRWGFALATAAAALSFPAFSETTVAIKGGRFYLYVENVKQETYYTMDYTAKAAAMTLALACGCEVIIEQPPLVVTVTKTGGVLLTWGRPTQREDGSALPESEIAGYVIEYGETLVEVTGYAHTVDGLAAGEYSFRIATVDTDGQRGAFSAPVVVVLP